MRRNEAKSVGRRSRVRGSSTAEYIALVGVVGLVAMYAFVARGKTMLTDYENARDLVLMPAQ